MPQKTPHSGQMPLKSEKSLSEKGSDTLRRGHEVNAFNRIAKHPFFHHHFLLIAAAKQ